METGSYWSRAGPYPYDRHPYKGRSGGRHRHRTPRHGSLDRVWGDSGVSQALLVRAGHQGMWPWDVQEMPKGEVGKSLVGRMLEG